MGTRKIPISRVILLLVISVLILVWAGGCQETKPVGPPKVAHPVFAKNGMVAVQEATAAGVGLEILKHGGNAVDAAVAIGFTLAVTLPRAGNLGGGGFMLVHLAKTGETVAIDYREMAPGAAARDMFLDSEGKVASDRSQFSYLAAGVPGTVAGLTLALQKYGTLSLQEVLAPAIRLAEHGIQVSPDLSSSLKQYRENLKRRPGSAKVFFKEDGSDFQPGEGMIRKDLAWSLKQIAAHGAEAFYQGAIAKKLVADMEANDGLITLADLQNYRAIIREPVRGTYRGYEIASMPPPSSGGIHLIQILNILEGYAIADLGPNSADTIHLMAESMKHAYADRSRHLGDPDFWKVPVRGLVSKSYAKAIRKKIDANRARSAEEIDPGNPFPYEESNDTTHFSVMDREGNAVANTYTLNFPYGSGIVAQGTGILLNNEMDDFSSKPGVPNAYGLIGGDANAIQAKKRPLSSMSPTIVFKEGQPYLATGSPGGSRIITTTLQIILNVIDHGMNIAAATDAPRIHHQWLPDELRVESALNPDTLRRLAAKGHRVALKEPMGSTQSILRTDAGFYGASDSRRPGALALGY